MAQGGFVQAVEALPGRGTSELLMPAVRRVLGSFKAADLDGVGVVAGPGSFTGLRVGLSAMKGLCEANELTMIAVSRLELLVADRAQKTVAILGAGRGEFYFGVYAGERLADEGILGREALTERMRDLPAVTCDAEVARVFGERVDVVGEPDASAMLRMVTKKIALGAWSDVALVEAHYLRRTDAELAVEG